MPPAAHEHAAAPAARPAGHRDGHGPAHGHGHSHGLVDESIKRSREGVRAVAAALAVLGLATVVQAVIFVASGSVALLADLIHNAGDALTAGPPRPPFPPPSPPPERPPPPPPPP